ncbi:Sec-independent protein translocase subunit TatA [Angustibacter peucedani]
MRNLFEHPLFIVILLVLVAVLFGGKRLPEAARGLGRSMRIFKSEIKQMQDDDDTSERASTERPAPVEGRVVDQPKDVPGPAAASEQRDTRA